MMKHTLTIFVLLLSMLAIACGGNKNQSDNDDRQPAGSPEKQAFLENFYKDYFKNVNDKEAVLNIVNDTERFNENALNQLNAYAEMMGVAKDALFRPAVMKDTVMNPENVKVEVNDVEKNENIDFFNVSIYDNDGSKHDIRIGVEGKGQFKITQLENPDYINE